MDSFCTYKYTEAFGVYKIKKKIHPEPGCELLVVNRL